MPDTDVTKLFKDTAYAAIGFSVLGFQRAQVARREFTEQLEANRSQLSERLGSITFPLPTTLPVVDLRDSEQVAKLRTQATEAAKRIDAQVQPLRRQLDDRLSEVEELLPAPTRTVVRTVRSAAASQEQALRSVIGLSA